MKRARFHEPSLVPLADMLTNTVGIVVFILIFTVLATGGAMVTKRLPMERASEAQPVRFLCVNGRVLPLDLETLVDKFLAPLGEPKAQTASDFLRWRNSFNSHTLEDTYFQVLGKSDMYSIDLEFSPRPNVGDLLEDLEQPYSVLRQTLIKYTSSQRFAYFIVADDSIEVFVKARQIATKELGYGYGWRPTERNQPYQVSLGGSGGGFLPSPQ